jgi:hypothetical protein
MATELCPVCAQHLPRCPVCRNPVLPKRCNPNSNIDQHLDKAGRQCKAEGLPYKLTEPPYPKGAA